MAGTKGLKTSEYLGYILYSILKGLSTVRLFRTFFYARRSTRMTRAVRSSVASFRSWVTNSLARLNELSAVLGVPLRVELEGEGTLSLIQHPEGQGGGQGSQRSGSVHPRLKQLLQQPNRQGALPVGVRAAAHPVTQQLS